ncbi:MAG: hypothetical protein GAK29_03536 [Acinetobacter bereziniae]|uniref:Uncharacterized protein n=1 Tax=Acinetobacter bereziniae TaxID=106648 RepID=A0A833PDP0_ACIBZ|nr:MAG: hypothetical protein GAK29_03536 [Acinetobacter bereziniae]
MPKLNLNQDTALDIIDFLYFYDVISLKSFTTPTEHTEIHTQLNDLISEIIETRNYLGKEAEIYKHLLLCGVEIGATYNVDRDVFSDTVLTVSQRRQAVRDLHEKANSTLRNEVEKKGFKDYQYCDDVLSILEKTDLENKSNTFSFSLVAKALAFDFDGCISTHVYRKFLDLKILETNKELQRNKYDYQGNEHIFLRAILFIEFEIMRNKLYHQNDRPNLTLNYDAKYSSERFLDKEEAFHNKTIRFLRRAVNTTYTSIDCFDLMSKKEMLDYLSDLEVHLCHNRMFSKNNAKWISLFGLWHLKYHEMINTSVANYSAVENDGTCSDLASKQMDREYGLSIKAKSLYLYSNKYKDFFKFIDRVYYEYSEAPKQGFINTVLTYYFYYHPLLSENIINIYDSFEADME